MSAPFAENIVTEKPDHSKRGASGTYIWMNCPRSVLLRESLIRDKAIPANSSSIYAATGTAAHDLGEKCLTMDMDAFMFMDQKVGPVDNQFTVDPDMADAVQVYLDCVRDKMKKFPNAIVKVEFAMSSILDDDAYGTGDLVIYVPGDRIIIIDYKHGIGVTVEASSPQLKYYAYLAYENRPDEMKGDGEPKVIELYVVQPRAPHHKGPIRRLVSNVTEITTWWNETLMPAMEETRNPDALLAIGEWCRFCPNRPKCPAMLQATQEIKIDKPLPAMTEAEIADIMMKKDALVKFFGDIEKEAFERARVGKKIITSEGKQVFKLVKKQANRAWKPGAEAMVELELGAACWTDPKFKSPAQIEECGVDGAKRLVAQHSFTPDTGLTLAPMSDRREEVKPLMLRLLDQQAAAGGDTGKSQ